MTHDLRSVVGFYEAALESHGDGPRAVGWDTSHTQQAAFLQLARIDGLEPGARVLDVGCGLGHLLDFFRARDLQVDYTGYDICAPLVEQARARHPDARFEHRDILRDPPAERFDVVLASGVFGVAPPQPQQFVGDLVGAMFGLAQRALGFNMLSLAYFGSHPLEAMHDTYYYADPGLALNMCLDFTPQVVLDHSDIGEQFALFLYRDNARSSAALIEHLGIGPEDDYGPGHAAVVEHLSTLGMRRRAIEFLESMEPSLEILDAIGYLGFELRDEAVQLQAWTRAAQLVPQSPVPLTRLATVHADAGRFGEATMCLERALALAPGDEKIVARLTAMRET